GLQPVRRTDQVDGAHAHQIAVLLLEPLEMHLRQRLELARETAVLAARALRHATLLPVLAGEEGDDAVAVVELGDIEEQGFTGEQAHGVKTLAATPRTPFAFQTCGPRSAGRSNAAIKYTPHGSNNS